MTMQDFVNGFYSESLWYIEYEEFKSEPFFVLGKDYNISMYDYDYNEITLNEGNNTYNENEVSICIGIIHCFIFYLFAEKIFDIETIEDCLEWHVS